MSRKKWSFELVKYIFNPFSIYSFIFIFILLIYPLGWSDIQPNLTLDLVIFISTTVFLGVILSVIYKKIFLNFDYQEIKLKNKLVWFFVLLGTTAEFLYGGIPIIKVLSGQYHDYFNWGVPTFHAFFLPYIISAGLISLYNFINSNNKNELLLYIFSIFFCVSIINRGAVIFLLFSSLVIYFLVRNSITFKKIIYTFFGGLLTLYLFGVIGNYRMMSSGYQGNEIILIVGQANNNFYQSGVPTEFFWSYLYLVTPLSNLQYRFNNIPMNVDIMDTFKYHILIDFLQKRIFSKDEFNGLLIKEEFNVSTMYGDVLQTSGIGGGVVLYFWYILVVLFITYITPKKYKIVVVGILCCISVLQCFTNIMVVAGYGLPPVLIALLSRFNCGKNRII